MVMFQAGMSHSGTRMKRERSSEPCATGFPSRRTCRRFPTVPSSSWKVNRHLTLFKKLLILKRLDQCHLHPKLHCKEPIPKIEKKYSQNKELRGHTPNFHINVSVSDFYIPTIDLPILLQEICGLIQDIYKSLTDTWMWKLGLRPRNSKKRNT